MSYIGLFLIGFLWSLPGFSITTAVAIFNNVRKCWNLRQPLKILVSPRMVLSKTVLEIPSGLGDLLRGSRLMMHFTDWLYWQLINWCMELAWTLTFLAVELWG
ncbi:unnamed protein product [Macrosiphum euphorbiae]|uniref:Uncharacterized protein n=1 Tax=Macrosiphum euphorbiae TaxID=13131 RepID=A0AAV0WN11_9HEMI|nr:unnamed protein product [Macrosiphum euphorbiae]